MRREQETDAVAVTRPARRAPRVEQLAKAPASETSGQITRRQARAAENRTESRPKGLIAVLVIAALVVGFGSGALVARQRNRARETEVMVAVNGVPIRKDAFYSRLEAKSGSEVMSQMVSEELQYQYAKSKGLAATLREVDERYARASRDPQFLSNLARIGQSPEAFKRLLLLSLSQLRTVSQGVKVTDAEMRKFYQDNIDPKNPTARFYNPEQIEIAVIVTRNQQRAQKALSELNSGRSFAVVAQAYSEDKQVKTNGGAIPAFPRGRTRLATIKGFEDDVFGMKIGSTLGPRLYAGAWWIVRCLDKTSGSARPYEDVKDECHDLVMQIKGQAKNGARVKADYEEFKKKARIQAFWSQYKPAAMEAP